MSKIKFTLRQSGIKKKKLIRVSDNIRFFALHASTIKIQFSLHDLRKSGEKFELRAKSGDSMNWTELTSVPYRSVRFFSFRFVVLSVTRFDRRNEKKRNILDSREEIHGEAKE